MTVRQAVAAALVAGLTDEYRIYPYPRNPDMVEAGRRAVCVWLDTMNRDGTFTNVRQNLTVWVLSGRSALVPELEDDLDTALADVLEVLTFSDPRWTWTDVERGVLQDTWHGYQITVTSIGTIEPPPPGD